MKRVVQKEKIMCITISKLTKADQYTDKLIAVYVVRYVTRGHS